MWTKNKHGSKTGCETIDLKLREKKRLQRAKTMIYTLDNSVLFPVFSNRPTALAVSLETA
jgi:hypothetical protein